MTFAKFMAEWAAQIQRGKIPPQRTKTMPVQQRYTVWFRDIEGNEDTLTVLTDEHGQQAITDDLQARKESGTVSDFTVLPDSPYTLAEALEYITDKMQDVEA